jgi:hypothetical protein
MDSQGCARVAQEADHIQRIVDGGDPFASSNMRGMCSSCHIERHRHDRGDGGFFGAPDADNPRIARCARRPEIENETAGSRAEGRRYV